MDPTIDVRRAADRFVTRTDWLDSRHSFSFGAHYDPANTHHGLLLVSNDDRVGAGAGFGEHPHRDMEIVSWVLAGALAHRDSAGNAGEIRPGEVQRMSAGTGVVHSERAAGDGPVHFVQMWVVPAAAGDPPSYQQADVDAALRGGALVAVASGRPGADAAVRLGNPAATLHAARLDAAGSVTLPDAPYLHVFAARGSVGLDGTDLAEGDAARISGGGGQAVTATGPAELLVWEMHAAL